MPYFPHDGIQFHYCQVGEGAPVVFQHGLGSDASQLVGLFQPPLEFQLLSMDFRGHGETRPLGPEEKLGMAAFADDLLSFLDELRIARAVVGGISMGAAVALNFALRFPHRVRALVLSRPCWIDRPLPPNARVFATIARHLRQYGVQEGWRQFCRSEEYQAVFREEPYVAQSLLGLFETPGAQQTAAKLERIAADAPCRSLDELAAIRAPTLVLANRRDPVHPFEYGEILARAVPGARLCEIASKAESESRHKADVQRAITEFLPAALEDPPSRPLGP